MSFKTKYFLSHLCLSAIIAVMTLWLVFTVWYPSPLYEAVGVTKIFLILLAVDLSLGPLLTLVIANAKKSRRALIFDLVVIGFLQISAYLYGMYKIELGRPIWIAFDTFRFELVQAAMLDYSELNNEAQYNHQPFLSKPRWVSVRAVASIEEKNARLFYELEHGIAPTGRPVFYQPLDLAWDMMIEESHALNTLTEHNSKELVDQMRVDYPHADAYLPLLAPQVDMSVLIDIEQKEIIDIVDLRPW